MKRLSAIATILAATTLVSLAAPRIALIRVKEIYAGLPSTAALQEQVKKERQDIMRSERANVLRRIINELKTLQGQLSDKKKPLDEATARKVARTYEIKRQEAQTLQKEFEDFRSEEEKKINRKLVTAMRESLDRIVTTSERIAKEKGCDTVFDSSGSTNTGVPFILYSKQSPDLTDAVKAALRDSTSASKPPATAAGKPSKPTKR